MTEFFKELIDNLIKIWNSLSKFQKVLVSTVVLLTFLGLLFIVIFSSFSPKEEKFSYLYKNLSTEDITAITDKLEEKQIPYKVENNSIKVPVDQIYILKMQLAKEGLPSKKGFIGYEIFDKQNFGVTDFQQKVNYKRAIEGELARTISTIEEIEYCRVHIVNEKESIFEDEKEPAKASVIVKLKPGKKLSNKQIQGIVYLVAHAVEGLEEKNITIIDSNGDLLTNPYLHNEVANLTSYQQQLQFTTERLLEKKVKTMLDKLLGPGKCAVNISLDLNFARIEQTKEEYNPEGGVVRSKQEQLSTDQSGVDQSTGKKENKIVNYEIDKTVSHIIGETGNIKRMTVAVAVDGKYEKDKDGKIIYKARTPEEIAQIEQLVKNAVGYDGERGDEIFVTNVQFDKTYLDEELKDIEKDNKISIYSKLIKYVLIALLFIILFIILRGVIKSIVYQTLLSEPEYPEIKEAAVVDDDEQIKKTNDMIAGIEDMVREDLDLLIFSLRSLMKTENKQE